MKMRLNLTRITLLLVSLTTSGCPKQSASSDMMPRWRTEEGKEKLHLELAEWHIDRGNTDEGLRLLASLREMGVHTPDMDLLQGIALLKDGLLSEAEPILGTVMKQMPKDPRPMRSLGVLYADSDRVDEAIDMLEGARRLDEEHAPTLNNLGYLYMVKADYKGAKEMLQAAIAIDGTDQMFRNNLAYAMVGLGEHHEALALFRTTGTEADARVNLGVGFERLGQSSAAVLQYQAALSINPHHKIAQESIARLQDEVQRLQGPSLNPEMRSPNPEEGTP